MSIPIANQTANALVWEPLDPQTADAALSGAAVTGAEPVAYPETDGLIIYLRDRSGALYALDVGADYLDPGREDGDNPFYMRLARVPLDAHTLTAGATGERESRPPAQATTTRAPQAVPLLDISPQAIDPQELPQDLQRQIAADVGAWYEKRVPDIEL